MPRPRSRTHRQAAFLDRAAQRLDPREAWYDRHPDARLGEIEGEARRHRRALLGERVAPLSPGRATGDRGAAPCCPTGAPPLDFAGYRPKPVAPLAGASTLERADSVCPRCPGPTVFPQWRQK